MNELMTAFPGFKRKAHTITVLLCLLFPITVNAGAEDCIDDVIYGHYIAGKIMPNDNIANYASELNRAFELTLSIAEKLGEVDIKTKAVIAKLIDIHDKEFDKIQQKAESIPWDTTSTCQQSRMLKREFHAFLIRGMDTMSASIKMILDGSDSFPYEARQELERVIGFYHDTRSKMY